MTVNNDKLNELEVAPEQFTPDPENANKGTPRGRKALKKSLQTVGAGRSVVSDKDGVILAGNKTLEEATKQGFATKIVDTDGKTLIVVRRTDLTAGEKKAQQLAIADNRVAELGLSWNPDALKPMDASSLADMELFSSQELGLLYNEGKGAKVTEKIDMQKPPKMLWVLLGIPFNRFDLVQAPLAALEAEADISVQSARDK